jgi:hypothetical protein
MASSNNIWIFLIFEDFMLISWFRFYELNDLFKFISFSYYLFFLNSKEDVLLIFDLVNLLIVLDGFYNSFYFLSLLI